MRRQTERIMDALNDTPEESGAALDTVLIANVYLKNFAGGPRSKAV